MAELKRIFVWTCSVVAGLALAQTALAGKQVIRVVVDGPIIEAPSPDAELMVLFGAEPPRTLRALVSMFDKAAKDSNVAGAALIVESAQMNLAQMEELTRAIRRFRDSGKKVFAYTDNVGNGTYVLASAADSVMLAENSSVDIAGFNAELSYYKGLLDKLGVQAEMLHCGDYKSALEPFTRTEPSKEAADNVNWLLDGLFERWIELIAQHRNLEADAVRAAVDQAPLNAKTALERKLIDQIGSFEDYRKQLAESFGADFEMVKDYGKKDKLTIDPSNPFAFFELITQIMQPEEEERKSGIGLIYIVGGIVTGKNEPSPFGGDGTAGSTTIRAVLDQAARDKAVKAVVLRVDSPGGSALASDIMWKAAVRLAQEKPVIVSMGGVAGSGGYYVALPGERIFAEATTITGSIGVVGGKLVLSGLFEDKLGIHTVPFRRGKNAALFSSSQTWNEGERAWMQKWMNEIYDQFKGRVKTSRGDRLKGDLEQLAGGRVFTGRQALEKGLVDEIGGLKDAIAYAAKKVNLPADAPVYTLPDVDPFERALAKLFGQEVEDEYELKPSASTSGVWGGAAPGNSSASWVNDPLMRVFAPLLSQLAPEQLRGLEDGLRNLVIIQRERVGMFMPLRLEVR